MKQEIVVEQVAVDKRGGTSCGLSRLRRFESGDDVLADRVVLAVGPWVHRLLGELRLPIRMTRQYLLYFANLPLSSFGLSTFPAFLADELYGFPIHPTAGTGYGPGWFKATSH